MAFPVGDIGAAFKTASDAAEQVRLQKPDFKSCKRSISEVRKVDNKLTKTYPPSSRKSHLWEIDLSQRCLITSPRECRYPQHGLILLQNLKVQPHNLQ